MRIVIFSLIVPILAATDELPPPTVRAAAVVALRETYRETVQGGSDRRQAFALLQIQRTIDGHLDAQETIARLVLAAEISQSLGRVDIILQAADVIRNRFGEAAMVELKRSWLTPMSSAAAKAGITLMDHPDDPASNDSLGSFYFQVVQDEEHAFAYWAKGKGRRRQIATLQVGGTDATAGAIELGDLWFEEGHETNSSYVRQVCFEHARICYRQAASGAETADIKKRLAEIGKILPEDPKDWTKLSALQWATYKGEVYRIRPTKDPTPIGTPLKEGQSYRLLPHPTDTWVVFSGGVSSSPTYRGMPPPISTGTKFQVKPPEFGAMRVWADGKPIKPGDVITGPATISCSVDTVGVEAENTVQLGGEGIRLKIVPIRDQLR